MNYRKSEAKEAAKSQFHGIWTAITTPFTPDFEVDEAGLRSNMKRIADLKIEGVFCTGVMGEFWSLTKEERKRIVEIVVEEAHRRGVKVIAHTATTRRTRRSSSRDTRRKSAPTSRSS